MTKGLYRDAQHKKIAGVCAGLAEYFSVDVTIVRVAFVLGVMLHAIGMLAYIILWIAMSEKPVVAWSSYQAGVGNNPGYQDNYSQPSYNVDTVSPASRRNAMIAGIALIVIGLYFLLVNLVPWFDAETYAPIFLVIAGVLILVYGFMGSSHVPMESWSATTNKATWTTAGASSTASASSSAQASSFASSPASQEKDATYSTRSSTSDTDTESEDSHQQHGGLS